MKINKTIIVSFVLLSTATLLVPMALGASPIVQQVTGGGWFMSDCTIPGKCTFGFNAEENPAGELKGNVEFVDHGPVGGYDRGYPHVHGYEITALTIVGKTATIVGNCWLNGDKDTVREFTVVVVDNGEPGTLDTFKITIPSISYTVQGELGFTVPEHGGGNIQIHVPAPP